MMRKFLMVLAATTMAVAPLATTSAQAAPNHKVEQKAPKAKSKIKQQHRWTKGQKFDSRYATNYRVIKNPKDYRLDNAPRGYQWVQSGNDAILVAITGGLIGAVIANAIN